MSLVHAAFVGVPPGAKPGFDHADVWLDGSGSRMYVAHTGADRVDVLDCRRRVFLRSLDGLPGVAGVLVDQEHDRLFTSDRAAARLSLFRCSDEKLLGRVAVAEAPNGLAYDPSRRRLYAFNVAQPYLATVVDIDACRAVAEIRLPGRPRWALYDEGRDCVYANIMDPPLLVVFDAMRAAMVDVFPVPSAGPHGLGLDDGRLFCAADGGALVVLDRAGGAVVATLSLPGVPDVVMRDPESRKVYVAVGDPGVVCSFDCARLEHLETVETEPGAHTIGWDRESQSLHVFCPQSCGAMVFEDRP